MTIEVPINTEAIDRAEQLTQQWPKFNLMYGKYAVTDDTSYRQVGDALRDGQARVKELETLRLSITRPMDEAKKRVMALFKPVVENYEKTNIALKTALIEYHKKLAAETPRTTVVDAPPDPDNPVSTALLEALNEAPAPATTPPKITGIHTRTTWKWKLSSMEVLVAAVATGNLPVNYLLPNEKLIGDIVGTLKGNHNIPGVMAYEEEAMVVMSR